MRNVLAIAVLATITSTAACTHHHRVAHGAPVPDDDVSHLRGALEGAGIGVLAGAAMGATLGYSSGDDQCDSSESWCLFTFTAEEKAVFGGIYGGGIGAISGLVIGAVVGSRDVYEAEAGPVPYVSATVAPGQVGASASWRF